jgi:hypothetical protein
MASFDKCREARDKEQCEAERRALAIIEELRLLEAEEEADPDSWGPRTRIAGPKKEHRKRGRHDAEV